MNIEVVKFDNLGRGIGYINDKIVFIPKTVLGDVVNVEVTLEKKNYLEARVLEIVKPSKLRIKPICPYFQFCGGCDLMQISLSEALEYKLNRVNEGLRKNNINYEVKDIIKSKETFNYRNKVSLKIKDKVIGYYENKSHELVEIDYCYLAKEVINDLIKDIGVLSINNGEVVIRANYNDELLIAINSNDEISNIDELVNNHKVVGIIKNDECIYGEDYFIDKIGDYIFKVSYNSFFQVNPYICENIFELVKDNTKNSQNILDLYSGVGTLSIVAGTNESSVVGVEVIKNAVEDAHLNKNLNNKKELEFICSDTKNVINKITNDFDTIILDPPRSGVAIEVIDKIINEKINNIIYISCNSDTLIRDLKLLLDNYEINDFKLLDMFPNTYHVESMVLLERK